MHKRLFLLFSFALLLFSSSVMAKNYADHRTYFAPKSKVNTLKITNKFGRIELFSSESDSVKVSVTLEVDENSERYAERFFRKIKVSHSLVNGKYAFATTLPELNGQKKEFSINYKIFAPDSMLLDIQSKFGMVDLSQTIAKGKINVAYGKLFASNMIDASVVVDYGSARIEKMENGTVKLNYSSAQIDTCTTLALSTKFSSIDLKEVNKLKVNGKGGKVRGDNISEITAEGSHINYSIQNIEKTSLIQNAFGNINIKSISNEFAKISITNKYGNISVNTKNIAGYNLDLEGTYSEVTCSEADNLTVKEVEHTKTIYGVVGSDNIESNGKQVHIRSTHGAVKL